jgi:O-antigen/teichoic acid export membrane protein
MTSHVLKQARETALGRIGVGGAVSVVMASTLCMQGARFIVDIFLAHQVAPRDYGVWKLVQVYILFAPLLLLGIPSGINRELPRNVGLRRPRQVSEIIGTGLLVSALALIVIAVGTVFVVPGGSAVPSALVLALWTMMGIACGMLNALEEFPMYAASQVIVAGVLLVLIPLPAVYGLNGFLASYAIASLISIAFAIEIVRRRGAMRVRWRTVTDLIRSGFLLAVIAFGYLATITLDRLAVSHFFGLRELGYYGLAATMFALVSTLPQVAVQVYYPQTLRRYAESQDAQELLAACRRQATKVLIFTALVAAAVAVVLVPAVRLVLPQYDRAIPAGYALLPGLLFLPAVGMYGNFLIAVGRTRLLIGAAGVNLMLQLVFLGIAVYLGSIVWVAAAGSVSYFTYYVLVRVAAESQVTRRRAERPHPARASAGAEIDLEAHDFQSRHPF